MRTRLVMTSPGLRSSAKNLSPRLRKKQRKRKKIKMAKMAIRPMKMMQMGKMAREKTRMVKAKTAWMKSRTDLD